MHFITIFFRYFGSYLIIAVLVLMLMIFIYHKTNKYTSSESIEVKTKKTGKARSVFIIFAIGLPSLILIFGLFDSVPYVNREMDKQKMIHEYLPQLAKVCEKAIGAPQVQNVKAIRNIQIIKRGEWINQTATGETLQLSHDNEVELGNGYWGYYFINDLSRFNQVDRFDEVEGVLCVDITYPTTKGCTVNKTTGEFVGSITYGVPFADVWLVSWPAGELVKKYETTYVAFDDRECTSDIDNHKLINLLESDGY